MALIALHWNVDTECIELRSEQIKGDQKVGQSRPEEIKVDPSMVLTMATDYNYRGVNNDSVSWCGRG